MAARKSCTHLTWAEAKAKVGGSSNSKSKSTIQTKKVPHNQILAHKIIAKQEQDGPTISRAKLRRAQREDEKAAAAIAAAREAEKEAQRNRKVKLHELARDRMMEIAKNLQASGVVCTEEEQSSHSQESIAEIKECKEMQLDELMALEAIYADTNEFLVSDASQLEQLQEIREALFEDDGNQSAIESFVQHPPISLHIQFSVDDYREKEPEMSLVAYVILSVSLPPRYPLGGKPLFELSDIMIVDKTTECSPDKTLESVAFLDETKLLDGIYKQAESVLPDPCVYEVATWLSENIFDAGLQMRTHASLT